MNFHTNKLFLVSLLTLTFSFSGYGLRSVAMDSSSGNDKLGQTRPDTTKATQLQPNPTSKKDSNKAKQKGLPGDTSQSKATDSPGNVEVVAYYFHRTHRCRTCLAIERNAHDAIKWYYSKELEQGKLRFIPLDMEKSENQHFVKDYQLYTSSLVLVRSRNGKQEKWENLQEVWLLVRDMEKFYKYVKENVDRFLEEAK